jgi:hydrogenase-4 component E
MTSFNEFLMALFLLSCLMLAVSSRMLHCIRIVSLQGILLAILPVTLAAECQGEIHWTMVLVNLIFKAVVLPLMLCRVMKQAEVRRELEPKIGYSLSAGIILLITLFCFFISGQLPLPGNIPALSRFAISSAFTVVLTGLFIIIARKKALTQVIGLLVFENGITLFGASVMRGHPVIVELGILLDVLVLVFIMGIAVYQISREFSHIDADRLNMLDDLPEKKEVER